jgi:hypothetical protein
VGLSGDGWDATYENVLQPVGEFVVDHRGTIVTGLAGGACLVPAVGWASCAGLQAVAYGFRAEQRVGEAGSFGGALEANIGDAVVTGATLGLVKIPMTRVQYEDTSLFLRRNTAETSMYKSLRESKLPYSELRLSVQFGSKRWGAYQGVVSGSAAAPLMFRPNCLVGSSRSGWCM